MTNRGKLVLALGLVTYGVAWLFGATVLYPAATGLVLAPLAARAWVRLAAGPIVLRRRAGRGALLEGDDVWVTLEALPQATVPPPSLAISERLAQAGRARDAAAA